MPILYDFESLLANIFTLAPLTGMTTAEARVVAEALGMRADYFHSEDR